MTRSIITLCPFRFFFSVTFHSCPDNIHDNGNTFLLQMFKFIFTIRHVCYGRKINVYFGRIWLLCGLMTALMATLLFFGISMNNNYKSNWLSYFRLLRSAPMYKRLLFLDQISVYISDSASASRVLLVDLISSFM